MKNAFLLLSFALTLMTGAIEAYAQGEMADVVHLKNGSIVRGTIIEQVPNESIKLRTKDGNIFVYKFSEIEKITKEEALAKPSEARTPRQRVFFPAQESFTLTPLVGLGVEDGYKLGFGLRAGVTLNGGFYAGATFVYYLGNEKEFSYTSRFTPQISTEYRDLGVSNLGAEVGYKFRSTRALIHPYLGLGLLRTRFGSGPLSNAASESKSHFYVAPAVSFNVMLNEQIFVGPDLRYTILVSNSTGFGNLGSSFNILLAIGFEL